VSTLASKLVRKPEWIVVCSRPPPHDCIITARFPEVLTILDEEHKSFED
jgi:hypothetical protein